MTTCLRAGAGAGFNYPFLTLKERDIETGLDYSKARYYSSTQGRFTSADSLLSSGKAAHPQSWSRYTYCLNNPLLLVDPDGLIWGKKKTSNNTEYIWFEGDAVGDGYDTVTEFNVEGVINGRMVALHLNPNGPRSFWAQLALNLDPALALLHDSSDYATKGYQIGPTKAQEDAFYRSGAVDMMPNQAFDVGLALAGGGLGKLNAGGEGTAATLRFSQTSASPFFSDAGTFAGRSIGEVANDLRSGVMSPSNVPIGAVNGADGFRLIVNTRSSLALSRAGIAQKSWSIVDLSANQTVRSEIQFRLFRNGPTSQGTDALRITGLGKSTSNLR